MYKMPSEKTLFDFIFIKILVKVFMTNNEKHVPKVTKILGMLWAICAHNIPRKTSITSTGLMFSL